MKDFSKTDFSPAVNELAMSLNTVKTNEPINRKSGHIAQANLEKKTGASITRAIDALSDTNFWKEMSKRK